MPASPINTLVESARSLVLNPTAKTIVDGSATTLFSVALAAGQSTAGMLLFSVFATDGTELQAISGVATYAAVNKAGTITRTITYVAANEAKAVTGASTLTLAFTATDDTNRVSFKVTPTGSLTETIYNLVSTILPLRGLVTLA